MSENSYSCQALKRGAWHYLTGKATSAAITFVILLWLVRLLPLEQYGVYVALIAASELAYAIGGLGLPWLAARYLPEYRLKASGIALVRVCRQILILQAVAFSALAGILFALGGHYLAWLDLLAYRSAAAIFLLVLVFEGLGRLVREPLMGPLMRQGDARISLIARQLLILVFLVLFNSFGLVDVFGVATIEAGASIVSFGLGWWLLERQFKALKDQKAHPDWEEPTLRAHWGVACRMYLAHLITLTYSAQVLTNVVMRVLGTEATALFGFLRALNDQVARYLPATLLFSLIRPKLVASYVGGGGMVELRRNANLVGKLSLFALAALIAFVALSGDALVGVLSGGKFADTGWLFLGFMAGLIPFSQRQLLESVAVTIGRPSVCVWASASGLVMLPLVWALLQADFGLWAPVIAIGVGHLAFNSYVLFVIARRDGYRADWFGVMKMLGSAALAYLIGAGLPFEWLTNMPSKWSVLLVQAILIVSTYLFLGWIFKPFSNEERERINGFFKKRVFIW